MHPSFKLLLDVICTTCRRSNGIDMRFLPLSFFPLFSLPFLFSLFPLPPSTLDPFPNHTNERNSIHRYPRHHEHPSQLLAHPTQWDTCTAYRYPSKIKTHQSNSNSMARMLTPGFWGGTSRKEHKVKGMLCNGMIQL
jgi:hypothetical protein